MRNTVPFLSDQESLELLEKHCADAGVSVRTIQQLVQTIEKYEGMGRRHGIFEDISEVIKEEIARREEEPGNVH